MAVKSMQATVYLAPTKGRRYLTKRSAVRAEAAAMLERKYPTERGDETDGFHHWHWSDDEQLRKVHARLVQLIARNIKADSPQGASDATTEVAVKTDAGFTAKQEASDA